MKIKIVNKSKNPIPAYGTALAAGLDLKANCINSITIQPLQRQLIPTGIFLEIPRGYECQVRPRSGLAINNGITVLNTPGTIDADYRGEIKVVLVNLSDTSFTIKQGDRIAQIVFAKFEKIELTEVNQLAESERGAGGFGHTGI